jgi:hypothetical protein
MMEDTGGKRSFSFQMQIGLTRDQINIDGELTLASLQEIACSFVDRKVRQSAVSLTNSSSFLYQIFTQGPFGKIGVLQMYAS